MADVAIVTASLGGHDVPHPQVAQDVDVDWYFLSDDLDRDEVLEPWIPIPVPPAGPLDPRLAAKPYRMIPWHTLDALEVGPSDKLGDRYRWIIWQDAAMEVTSPHFASEVTAAAACVGAPLMAWRHPRRDCVYDEATWSLIEAPEKYAPIADELEAQCIAYKAEGYPEHHGLYATGTLVWNMRAGGGEGAPYHAHVLGAEWLAEVERTTIQDQVSLPVVAWRLGMEVATFPEDQIVGSFYERDRDGTRQRGLYNRWMKIHPHTRVD